MLTKAQARKLDADSLRHVWNDCENATLSYDIDPPGVMGTIELQRITPDNVVLCETLAEGN